MPGKAIRLVHVTTVPWTLEFLSSHVEMARECGLDVAVVSAPGDLLDDFANAHGVRAFELPFTREITPLRDIGSLRRLSSIFRNQAPHIVHGHTPKAGLLSMTAAAVSRVPVRMYHLHGLPHVTATGWKRAALRMSEQISCRLATRVYAVSPSLMKEASWEPVCDPKKIRVLGSGSIAGVDAVGRFDPARIPADETNALRASLGVHDDAFVVGFVGRLVRDKGIEWLVSAWKQMREVVEQETHLVLVGPLELRDVLSQDLIKLLEADPRIHTTGFVRNPEAYYRLFDVAVLPSQREGFGMSALEASAMTVPVIASRVTGCVDAVSDGTTGMLVDARDKNELAAALQRYAEDGAVRREHGDNGRSRALKDFNPKHLAFDLMNEYLDALEQQKSSATLDLRAVKRKLSSLRV